MDASVERLKAALEHLDGAIDGLALALEKRSKGLERVIEERAAKRVKTATDTADRALKQAQQREAQAAAREAKQKEVTGHVASRLDQAILRLEKIVGS